MRNRLPKKLPYCISSHDIVMLNIILDNTAPLYKQWYWLLTDWFRKDNILNEADLEPCLDKEFKLEDVYVLNRTQRPISEHRLKIDEFLKS